MQQDKCYKILSRYLRQHLFTVLVFLGFIGIFGIVFQLYDLETEAVFYSAGLCSLFAAAVLSVHFFFYIKNHISHAFLLEVSCLLVYNLYTVNLFVIMLKIAQ